MVHSLVCRKQQLCVSQALHCAGCCLFCRKLEVLSSGLGSCDAASTCYTNIQHRTTTNRRSFSSEPAVPVCKGNWLLVHERCWRPVVCRGGCCLKLHIATAWICTLLRCHCHPSLLLACKAARCHALAVPFYAVLPHADVFCGAPISSTIAELCCRDINSW